MATETILNRKALRDFHILERYEAGIELKGSEVKSIRAGKANISDAFVRIEKGQAFLYNADIQPYERASHEIPPAKRVRKLLLHRQEIDKLKGTLVDFNELEHVLDDVQQIGAWQIELRKLNDDPLDLDELILHVQKLNGCDETQLSRELSKRCFDHLVTAQAGTSYLFYGHAERPTLDQGVSQVCFVERVELRWFPAQLFGSLDRHKWPSSIVMTIDQGGPPPKPSIPDGIQRL